VAQLLRLSYVKLIAARYRLDRRKLFVEGSRRGRRAPRDEHLAGGGSSSSRHHHGARQHARRRRRLRRELLSAALRAGTLHPFVVFTSGLLRCSWTATRRSSTSGRGARKGWPPRYSQRPVVGTIVELPQRALWARALRVGVIVVGKLVRPPGARAGWRNARHLPGPGGGTSAVAILTISASTAAAAARSAARSPSSSATRTRTALPAGVAAGGRPALGAVRRRVLRARAHRLGAFDWSYRGYARCCSGTSSRRRPPTASSSSEGGELPARRRADCAACAHRGRRLPRDRAHMRASTPTTTASAK